MLCAKLYAAKRQSLTFHILTKFIQRIAVNFYFAVKPVEESVKLKTITY